MPGRKDERSAVSGDAAVGAHENGFDDAVRERAYLLYESRLAKNAPGDPLSDWLEAEEQIRYELNSANEPMS